MRLVLQLIIRLLAIVMLCLGAATIWTTVDAHRSIDRATAASAERVSRALEGLYWRELMLHSSRTREHLLPVPECIRFEPAIAFEKPLCGQNKGLGKSPPAWFTATVQMVLGNHQAVTQPLSIRATTAGTVAAFADPEAAIWLAWEHISDIIDVALLMAVAIGLFASLAIAHALAPARSIVAALQRMARGDYRTALPRLRSLELSMIGQAVTDLGERLAQSTEQQAVLTRRLLDIRDECPHIRDDSEAEVASSMIQAAQRDERRVRLSKSSRKEAERCILPNAS